MPRAIETPGILNMKYAIEFIVLAMTVAVAAFVFDVMPRSGESGYFGKLQALVSGDRDDAEEDDSDETGTVDVVDGDIAVNLPWQIQQQAGIEVIILEQAALAPVIPASGKVVDIRPLLEFRSRYRAAESEKQIAESALLASRQDHERLRVLHGEASNISERQLQQAKAQWLADQALVNARLREKEDIRGEAVQAWGEELVRWALEDNEVFGKLMTNEYLLLLVTLRDGRTLPDNAGTAQVSRGNGPEAQEAFYISPALHADALIQGETHYFYTPAGRLRTAMRVDVRIPTDDAPIPGVTVPADSIIWYVDRPWVYLQKDSETFVRRALVNYREGRDGWFVEEGVSAGERLVLHGAQMLLSEEFRWSIPDEDDNL